MAEAEYIPSEPQKEKQAEQPEKTAETDPLKKKSAQLRGKIAELQKDGKELTHEQLTKIYEDLQKTHSDLLKALEIRSFYNFRDFITIANPDSKPELQYSRKDVRDTVKHVESILYSYDAEKMKAYINSISPDLQQLAFCEVASQEGNTVFLPKILPYIFKCPEPEKILVVAVTKGDAPHAAFYGYKDYRHLPNAIDILKAAAPSLYAENVQRTLEQEEFFPSGSITKEQIADVLSLIPDSRKQHPDTIVRNVIREPDRANLYNFWADKGVKNIIEVREAWIAEGAAAHGFPLNPESTVQMRAMISRNLFFQNKPVNQETVVAEMARIIEMHEKYKDIKIFDRNIVVAAHGEELLETYDGGTKVDFVKAGGKERFGKKALLEAMKKQQTGEKELASFRPKDQSREAAAEAKKGFMNTLATMSPPLTVVLDGHGGPDAFYFKDGEVAKDGVVDTDADVKITFKEMADAFAERAQKFPQLATDDPSQKDILIFACCYSSNLLRSVYDAMGTAPKPIAMGVAEYGQLGFSDFDSPHGNRFFSKTLGLESPGASTIGTFLDHDLKDFSIPGSEYNQRPNASLYIPDHENVPMQITQNEENRRELPESGKA